MQPISIPTLETERLRLRPFRAGDFEDFAAMWGDPEVMRGLGRKPYEPAMAWRQLAFLIGHWELSGAGVWAVEAKAGGAFLGQIGFADGKDWPGFELCWTLARRWWGNGYATEGARAALGYAFTRWGKDRVISLIPPENRASIRVAERLGESLRGRTQADGKECLIYGIDRPGKRRRARERRGGGSPTPCPAD